MKLIKPYFEFIEQETRGSIVSLQLGMYRQIERIGRVCYKSEDKIDADSHIKFVEKLIKSNHGAMLEHGTVYLNINQEECDEDRIDEYQKNPYTEVYYHDDIFPHIYSITTNYRVLLENSWLDDLQYFCEPTKYHEKRICVKFVCDRGVSHELVRHRVFSFAQESTRYCNYSKDKFNKEITFIIPKWLNNPMLEDKSLGMKNFDFDRHINSAGTEGWWLKSLNQCEEIYFALLSEGWQPQQARAVLPNSLKTEVVMTGFVSDWQGKVVVYNQLKDGYDKIIDYPWSEEFESHTKKNYGSSNEHHIVVSGFFPLRTALTAHPQMQELAVPLYKEFQKHNLLKDVW